MGLLNIIHRIHLRQNLSIREIARHTGLSRNAVTKYLATNTIELTFATPERQSKLNPFAVKLVGWLKTEVRNSGNEWRTLKRLYADLVALGFTETRTWADVDRCEYPSSTQATSRTRSAIGRGLPNQNPHICQENKDSQVTFWGNPASS
jgi:hypothetical protein